MSVGTVARTLAELLFPPRCLACGARCAGGPYDTLCTACLATLEMRRDLVCPVCGARRYDLSPCHTSPLRALGSALEFRTPAVRDLLHAAKFKGVSRALLPLADRLADFTRAVALPLLPPTPMLLVPIPLSPARERERGFNQAQVVAERLAAALPGRFEVLAGAVRRTKATKPQTDAPDIAARARNVAGAFALVRPEPLAHRTVILVDDVFTSGATMLECARTLRAGKPALILGLTVARA